MIENPKDIEDFNNMYNKLNLVIPPNEIYIDLKCQDYFWDMFINKHLELYKPMELIFNPKINIEKIKFKTIFLPEYGNISRII